MCVWERGEGRRVEGVGCLFLLQLRNYGGFCLGGEEARSELLLFLLLGLF